MSLLSRPPVHHYYMPDSGAVIVLKILLMLIALFVALFLYSGDARAEYGDVVLNRYSDEAKIRPVIFPHWFHRIRYRCKTCHSDLGIQLKAGGSDINMFKIINGEYCGACHNGKIAWSVENCDLCHSAAPGTATQVHKSTMQTLLSPLVVGGKK